MLNVDDVNKSYTAGGRVVQALRGASMSIDGPGFYAIMGASGSGKTTLLHLLGAMDKPDGGTITIGGERIDQLSERALTDFRRRRVGIVFQAFNLLPTLTALENAELPGLLGGDDPAVIRARAMELLESLGVSHRASHRPDSLSGGEQQRVAIARALLYRPALVLADEPTGALDSKNAEALWSLLGRVAREQQTTVVMVTHEPAAAAHCRRVFVLLDGAITGSFDVPEQHDDGAKGNASLVAARYQQLIG
ncbi:MAG: ABC transporter ATP-binding protein [Phycisphaeraceae bacterium]|jgi:putative ABC transport system ATP-binding protein|nr:ABC transporter ATP-binding protein [Phycisphaeraceae bacterium]